MALSSKKKRRMGKRRHRKINPTWPWAIMAQKAKQAAEAQQAEEDEEDHIIVTLGKADRENIDKIVTTLTTEWDKLLNDEGESLSNADLFMGAHNFHTTIILWMTEYLSENKSPEFLKAAKDTFSLRMDKEIEKRGKIE